MRWVIRSVAAVLALSGCAGGAVAVPSEAGVAANRVLLAELPMLDGEPLLSDDTVGPVGGVGAMSSVVHEAPAGSSPAELGDRFEAALDDWTVICRVDRQFRTALDLRRDDAWLSIGLGRMEIDEVSRPTISVAVNTLDGEIMETEHVSRQPCD